jgi:tetratricopeptide (TPR) repeat protein
LPERRFVAFISYRRGRRDSRVAAAVQRAIEGYRVPRALRQQGAPARPGRVYLDVTEGSAGTPLSKEIQGALRASEYLVVLCSPEAKQSTWVTDEIRFFQQLGRSDRVLPVLVAGEPPEAFPAPLSEPRQQRPASGSEDVGEGGLVTSATQPVAADIRAPGWLSTWLRLREEKLRLLAPMLGVGFDALKDRQRERQRQQRRIILGLLAVVLTLLAGAFGYAVQQRVIAHQRLNAALDTANRIVFNMHEKLALTPGSAEARLQILKEASELTTELGHDAPGEESLLYLKAVIGAARGDLELTHGRRNEAEQEYLSSLELSRKLAQARPGDNHLELLLGHVLQSCGDVRRDMGRRAEARSYYEESVKVARGALQRDGAIVAFHELAAAAHAKLGDLALAEKDPAAALQSYEAALGGVQRVYDDDPAQPQRMEALATMLEKVGTLLRQERQPGEARPFLERDLQIRRKLAKDDPASPVLRREFAVSLERLADLAFDIGSLDEAKQWVSESLQIRKSLHELERGNQQYQRDLAGSYERASRIAVTGGDLDAAASMLVLECDILRKLKEDQPDAQRLADLSTCLDRHGDVVMQQGRIEDARALYRQLLECAEDARVRYMPPGPEEHRSVAVAHEKLGVAAMWLGAFDEAADHLKENLRLRRELANDAARVEFQLDLAIAEWNMGELERYRRRFEAAEGLQRSAEAHAAELASGHPEEPVFRRLWGVAKGALSEVARERGDTTRAQRQAEAALKLFRQLAEAPQAATQEKADMGSAAVVACKAQRLGGVLEAAEVTCREAVRVLQEARGAFSPPEVDRSLLDAQVTLAGVLRDRKRAGEARVALASAEEIAQRFVQRHLYRGEVVVQRLEAEMRELRKALGN